MSASRPRRILVCDGEQRTALAVVRSLSRAGHEVAVCSHERPCLGGVSRHARHCFAVPNPVLDADAYVTAIRGVVQEWRADLILPVTDQSNLALLAARETLSPAVVIGPPLDVFRRVADKRALLELAREQGIDTPDQRILESRDYDAPVLRDLAYPIALKPSQSVSSNFRHTVAYANDAEQLRETIRDFHVGAFPVLLQQRIVGPGVGVFLFIREGRVIATFAHERLREAPPSGGAAVYSRSIAMPVDLLERCRALLLAIGWDGVAMIEFKRDRASGRYYLMEINGRLWGSLQLAIDAGVDFPALMVDAEDGVLPTQPPTYRVGARLRSIWRDVDLLLVRLVRTRAALHLPVDAPGRLGALFDFLRWAPGERSEVFRLDDTRPFRHEGVRYLKRRLRL